MAKNPKFNNSDMFKDVSDTTHNNIDTNNNSEVLATQGNVINSIKTFWNNLRTKLAYTILRPDYSEQVGGNYVPIFVNADGVVQECQPTTIQADIAQNGIITIPTNDIPNDNIYTGTTVCISVLNNSASGSTNDLQIQHKDSESLVKYPSGVTVQAKDISNSDHLLATFCKTSTSSRNNFWILLNKINTVVSTTENGGHPGLMTAEDKAKLETIAWSANNYILPKATDKNLGGVKSSLTGTITGRDYNVQVNSDGTMKVNVPWTDTTYSLPTASSSKEGGVKLGADKVNSLETPNPTSSADRYYPIQTDKDDKLVVNVPWTDNHNTAYLRAGNDTSISNEATNNGDTYLKIVDGGSKSSSLKISGTGGTEVKSDVEGNITISSQSFNPLNISSTNKDPSKKYTVKGAGNNANQNNYLRGDGSWGPVTASMGSMTASINNGTYDPSKSNSFSGTLKVTYNGSPIQFALLRDNNFKVSDSNGSLLIDGVSIKPNTSLDGNSIALIVPIGNLSLKPQILHFKSTSTVTFMD